MIDRKAIYAALALCLVAAAPIADVRIADTAVYPESLSADRAGRLYIGSIKGVIFRTAPNGDVAEPWIKPDAQNGILGIFGVLVDEPSHTLWVCSSAMPPRTGATEVLGFDLRKGALKQRYAFPAPGGTCNDIAIGADRTLYSTDTPNGRILMLRPGGKALSLLVQDPRLRGIDGIAFTASGAMIVNNVQRNQMLRVERNADGSFRDLTMLTLSQPVSGPDGLRPIGGERLLQAEGGTGRIAIVTISGDRAEIEVIKDGLDSTAGVTRARGRAYAAEGKIRYMFDPKLKSMDPGPFMVRAIPLP